jgi:cellulose synthase/poly-beta-1,6-N-acetylglucosamine synthase-like glycosyltransferase
MANKGKPLSGKRLEVVFLAFSLLLCFATIVCSLRWGEELQEQSIQESKPLFLQPKLLEMHHIANAEQWWNLVCSLIVLVCNLTLSVPTACVTLRRRLVAWVEKKKPWQSLDMETSIDAIIPCFLPNEQDIIEETLWHILENVQSPGDLKLWLVYNTPEDVPDIEERLRNISTRKDLPRGRSLVVMRVATSNSKAENINHVLPHLQAKYTVMYDADHHPDSDSLLQLVATIVRNKSACVWGSTYIRDLGAGFWARIIDAEFFVTHFIAFPSLELLTGAGIFGGSNGLWDTKVLQSTYFSPSMQTEDIDLSVRMLLQGYQIDVCPEARSGELAPSSLKAVYKQRLRWAMGWDELSLKRFHDICSSSAPLLRRLAVAYVCYSRWLLQLSGILACFVLPLMQWLRNGQKNFAATELVLACTTFMLVAFFSCVILEAICQTRHRGRQSWIQVFFVLLFLILGHFFVLFNAILISVSLWRNFTGALGTWTVTARSHSGSKNSKADVSVRRPAISTNFIDLEAASNEKYAPIPVHQVVTSDVSSSASTEIDSSDSDREEASSTSSIEWEESR